MSIFLSNDVVVFLFIEIVLLLLMIVSEYSALKILKGWDFSLTTSAQYFLEKRNYLVNTLIYFTMVSKIVLFVYFVKSLDELSYIVPGSMCAAGVMGANVYGNLLLVFKIFILFLLGVWIVINKLDLSSKVFPYTKEKYYLFSFVFLLICGEFALELVYFLNIPLTVPVYCCTTVFRVNALPFELTNAGLMVVFYSLFVLILIANFFKHSAMSFLLNAIFLFCAYYAVTYFFGTYVYELPNHKCPFCMLQREYYYVGYVIWTSLLLGVFFGIAPLVIYSLIQKSYTFTYKYSSLFHLILVSICTAYVVLYYLRTGVFL